MTAVRSKATQALEPHRAQPEAWLALRGGRLAPPGPASMEGPKTPSSVGPEVGWRRARWAGIGLRKRTAALVSDFCDVLVEPHIRAVNQWVALFDNAILANNAVDGLSDYPDRHGGAESPRGRGPTQAERSWSVPQDTVEALNSPDVRVEECP